MNLSLKKLQLKHKLLAFMIVSAIFFIVFFQFIIIPQRNEVNKLSKIYQMERKKVDSIQTFAAAHADIDNYLLQLDKKLAYVNKMLPETIDMANLLIELQAVSRETGVEIYQLKPHGVEKRTGYSEFPLELLIRGSYFNQLAFLKKLNEDVRFNSIDKLNMQHKDGLLHTKITLVVYCYGGQATANNGKLQ